MKPGKDVVGIPTREFEHVRTKVARRPWVEGCYSAEGKPAFFQSEWVCLLRYSFVLQTSEMCTSLKRAHNWDRDIKLGSRHSLTKDCRGLLISSIERMAKRL